MDKLDKYYNVLVVGLGKIGMGYDYNFASEDFVQTHCQAVSKHNGFKLECGVDGDNNKIRLFEEKFKKPGYQNLKEALKIHKPNIIVISTNTSSHLKIMIDVFKMHKPVAIICEKPLAEDLLTSSKIIDICKKNQCKLYVNYMRRSDPGAIKIKEMIDNNTINSPMKVSVWYSKGLFNNGSHALNLLEYWLGQPQNCIYLKSQRIWGDSDPEIDFYINFKKGDAFFFSGWEEKFSLFEIELLCPNGRLRYFHGGQNITWEKCNNSLGNNSNHFLESDADLIDNKNMKFYQLSFYINLYNMLTSGSGNISMGHDAFETIRTIDSIIKKGGENL